MRPGVEADHGVHVEYFRVSFPLEISPCFRSVYRALTSVAFSKSALRSTSTPKPMHRSTPTWRWTSTSCTPSLGASSSIPRRRARRGAYSLPETPVRHHVIVAKRVLHSPYYSRTDIKLSASPNVTAHAQVAAHLKPRLEFGATILNQTADIFLELDAYAELDLALTAAANGSVSTDGSNSISTGIGGCMDILAGLSVNAGADADLLGIFDVNDTVSLYNKSFDLFKECFGDNFQKRTYRAVDSGDHTPLPPFEQDRRNYQRRTVPESQVAAGRRRIVRKRDVTAFSCPTSPMNGLLSIVSELVDGAR